MVMLEWVPLGLGNGSPWAANIIRSHRPERPVVAGVRRDNSQMRLRIGGEGNRTPVLIAFHADIYMFSRC